MTRSEQLENAIRLHQAGQLQPARQLYQAILATPGPDYADAHHFLGMLEHQAGNMPIALEHLTQAVHLDSSKDFFFINYANLLKDLGRFDESERAYLRALELQPVNPITHFNLGHLYQMGSKWQQARSSFGQAVQGQPDFFLAWTRLAAVHLHLNDLELARQAAQTAITLAPDQSSGWFHLADCQGRVKQWVESCESLEKAVSLQPVFPEAHNNLGMTYHELGRPDQARQSFMKALEQDPRFADPCINISKLEQVGGTLEDAGNWLVRALELRPDSPQAHFAMGNFLVKLGREQEGASHLRQAIILKPDFADALNNLGNILLTLQRHDEGLEAFQRAIACRPDYHEAYANMGNLHREARFPDLAEEALLQSIRLKPDFAAAHSNLGNAYFDQGKIDQAIESYKKGIDLGQDDQEFVPNYLFALNYSAKLSAAEIGAEHQRLCKQKYAALGRNTPPHPNTRDPNRRIRVGYVSPDFWMHPVARFMLPLLEHHNKEGFETFAYYTRLLRDGITEHCARRADNWRDTHGNSDEELAALIRQDQIDILVDLTMYSRDCKPGLFARKPAPLQVSYLAYAGTTGMEAIPYRLTDIHLDPPGQPTPGFHEEPLRLPVCWWNFQVPPEPQVRMPEVSPPPCLKNGYVTFGSLNNFVKVNPVTRLAWARLVASVPGSRLLLHMKQSRIREDVLGFFEKNGVSSDRITIIGYQDGPSYMRTYGTMDIALDPFPFAGGTTTFDALWMGVPVVTLAGDRPVGRGGLSILSTLGHPEWVGHSIDGYIAVAQKLASSPDQLAAIRQGLRVEIQNSPLMDSARFAREVEKHFRDIWQKWCTQPGPA
jgi:predicted O-linked N-acetylglucosamine transferase (SPINDLY family)